MAGDDLSDPGPAVQPAVDVEVEAGGLGDTDDGGRRLDQQP
ncbi:hypothetical protein ABZ568_26145 [Streptomyces olindensis]|uniref:Uncharacterized protein n=1 Tax=Streptomyces olindensis TaxID=358823 RepID=A0ABV2Y0P8_9ACTN